MRQAIAMIELIFALVIIGIVLLSAPQLIRIAAQGGYVAIQQEAVNEAATQVNIIMGHYWDENNTDTTTYPIILQTSGDNNLSEKLIIGQPTGRRYGTPKESFRTFVRRDGSRGIASTIGQDSGDSGEDDIDDFDGTATSLTLVQSSTDAAYVETVTINIDRNVSYLSDTPSNGTYIDPGDNSLSFVPQFNAITPSGTTNIKQISVTLTSNRSDAELQKKITLRAFSCNIGSYQLEEQ